MKGKKISESRTTMTEVVLPNDANNYGNILGGKVMHLMDMAAAIAALRHCRKPVVTVSVDSLHFVHPIPVGQLVLLEAVVTRSFSTSVEVQVEVFSENPLSGKQEKTSSAFLTFVALDSEGHPLKIAPVIPKSVQEKDRYQKALDRRRRRLKEVKLMGTIQ